MPRIETPELPEERQTWDLCNVCWLDTTDRLDDLPGDYDAREYETEVEHPPYQDLDYQCDECGRDLGENDNIWNLKQEISPGLRPGDDERERRQIYGASGM